MTGIKVLPAEKGEGFLKKGHEGDAGAANCTLRMAEIQLLCKRMNDFSNGDFDIAFLEEGFSARDILESKINEVSHSDDKDAFYSTVSTCIFLIIGGGFPGSEDTKLKFEEIAAVINPALDKYFPTDFGVQVIAEPGWFYVASAYTLSVNIIAKKVMFNEQSNSDDEDDCECDMTLMHYVNDGVYGSFNCILYDPAHVMPVLVKKPKSDERLYLTSIWGPTCDWLDRCNLPELQVGDWMVFENMGACTVAAASTFNGFQRPQIFYVMSRPAWKLMQQTKEDGFLSQVEDRAANTLLASCAWESEIELLCSSSCPSARVNVQTVNRTLADQLEILAELGGLGNSKWLPFGASN
ncbi:hypothetical protein scyTo_0001303 [Scyliorhinus torazame]|uniref:ornithine decarboxylase n=1 Tax=Scyliorhinus torazame TaxID=75743 RepID=A0A401PBM4_SCYTO|nr:hypothetical protein [Scyliorhinus torazame]